MMDQKNKTENSVLLRHSRDSHGGEEQAVEAKVRKGFRRDATLRQITKALDIKHERTTININKKVITTFFTLLIFHSPLGSHYLFLYIIHTLNEKKLVFKI